MRDVELSTAKTVQFHKRTGSRKEFLKQNGELLAAILSGVLIVTGWMLSVGDWPLASVACYLTAFVIGGYAKGKEGIEELIRDKQLNVEMLMILAAIGSAVIGYWAEGAMLIFIFALSGALETYAMNRSRRDISSLMARQPDEARLYENGVERKVPVKTLRKGQVVVVKPGDLIPVDGTVVEGVTSVDQSAITGESLPVEKKAGDDVLAGTVNVQGGILVRVDKLSDETLFQKMVQLVQKAQSEKPPQQHFIEKFERRYVVAVLVSVACVMLFTPFLLNWSWNEAAYRGMVLLVVASPCALVASVMPALLSAISNGARRGVLFKSGNHVQNLQGVRVIAFDKTGTLTKGVPEVRDIVAFHGYDEKEVLQAAASIEQLSTHPLAEAIVKRAREKDLPLSRPEGMESVTGFGITGKLNGALWKVGKEQFVDAPFVERAKERVNEFARQGKTVVFVQRERELVGLISLEDVMRPAAKQVIEELKRQGIYTVMLTGDSEETGRSLAAQAGVDAYYANCLPDEKVKRIQKLQERYGKVVMVGDGVNDAPALATASVGVGMGEGTDVALETADVVLVKNELKRIPYTVRLAKRVDRVTKQNIAFSTAVIIALITANFFQSITLPLGVIGHEGSTILVILNGLRLLAAK